MTTKSHVKRFRTTLGDLIVALTDAARSCTDSDQNAYRLVGLVLNKALQPAPVLPTLKPRKRASAKPPDSPRIN